MYDHNKQHEKKEPSFFIVPTEFLKSIAEGNERILSILTNGGLDSENAIGGFISENEAKKLLNKKTTWFWNMRKSGELAFSKVGGTNYYRKADLLKLLENNKNGL